MSKGMGTVQRAALEQLEAAGGLLDSIEIAGRVFDAQTVSQAQAVSVRRALERAGQVEDMGRGFHDGRRRWALPARAAEYRGRARLGVPVTGEGEK